MKYINRWLKLLVFICWMLSCNVVCAGENVIEVQDTEQGFCLQVRDEDPNWEKSMFVLKYREERTGEPKVLLEMPAVVWREEDGRFTAEIITEADGIYEACLCVEDMEGNMFGPVEAVKEIDRTVPEVTEVIASASNGKIAPDGQIFFSNTDVNIFIRVRDVVSGLKGGSIWVREEDAIRRVETYEWNEATGEMKIMLTGTGRREFGVRLEDTAGNGLEEIFWIGQCVIETDEPKAEMSLSGIVGENDFYRSDVEVKVSAGDGISGIRKVKLMVNDETMKSWEGNGALSVEKEFTLEAALFEGENRVRLVAEDRAGNQTTEELSVKIDGQPPQAELNFRSQEVHNSLYYSKGRSAVLTVREKHFEAERIKIWNGDELLPSPVFVKAEGEELYTAEVGIDKDGRYELWIEASDSAGNAVETQKIPVFVIDTKAPDIRVEYEDGDYRGTAFAHPRTAVVRIAEVNPDYDSLEWEVRVDGKKIKTQSAKEWLTFNGSRLKGTVDFEEEGTYKWSVKLTDLAGNVSSEWTGEEFLLDFTPPVLEFTGISNGASVREDARFAVLGTDDYLQKESMQVQVSRDGKTVFQKFLTEESETGLRCVFDAIPYASVWDGHYSVNASCRDTAGNSVQKTWSFTVNRLGSELKPAAEFRKLLDMYYVNELPEVCFSERNADVLKERTMFLDDETGVRILEEGIDYIVTHTEETTGWHLYEYRINEGVFKKDGMYRLSLHTKDRAGNMLDSREKFFMGFFVDRVAPEIFIHDIPDGRISADEKCVRVIVRDEGAVRELRFLLDGRELGFYTESEIANAGGVFRFYPETSEKPRKLVVEAVDAAGNHIASDAFMIENGEENTIMTDKADNTGENNRISGAVVLAGLALTVVIIVHFIAKRRGNPQSDC